MQEVVNDVNIPKIYHSERGGVTIRRRVYVK